MINIDWLRNIGGSFAFYYGVGFTTIIAGVVLVYLTEDGVLESSGSDIKLLKDPKTSSEKGRQMLPLHTPKKLTGKCWKCAYRSIDALIIAVNEGYAWYWGADPVNENAIVSRLCQWALVKLKRIQFFAEAKTVMASAQSRTHFATLMEARLLGIPSQPDEDEISTYVNVKEFIGKKWPFMWEVQDVKSDKILCAGLRCIPMSSYSYLDLIRDERVQQHALKCAGEWATGNLGPRMLGGNTSILCELERRIAKFFDRDAALLCAAGYLATMSAVAGVASENDVMFADSRVHASLRTGLKISPAKIFYFKHNDFKLLDGLLKQHRHKFNSCWLVLESVYSMDGDICDLPAANECAKKWNAKMIMDEAHGLGVLGKTGRGVEEHFNLQGVCTILCGTFSKSVSSIGGYITGPRKLISYLDFYAPGNVFSAPLSAYHAGAAIKAFEIMDQEPARIHHAQEMSRYLRKCLETGLGKWPSDFPESAKFVLEGDPATTVLPVVFPNDIDRVMRVADRLRRNGYMVSAVAYPACPLTRPRFRITATSRYTPEVVEGFVAALVDACIQEPVSDVSEMMTALMGM